MAVSFKIVDKRERFDSVRSRLRGFVGRAARVGLHEDEQAVKGMAHEFGTSHVPKRAWMGPSTDGAIEQTAAKAERAITKVADGSGDADDALMEIGQVIEEAQQAIILDGKVGGPPLSPEAMRNDPRKLYDTGYMVHSIATIVGPDKDGE